MATISFDHHNSPLISVIINCFNGGRFVKTAIDSVYTQTYKNWEIIFWDNASIDNSADIAKSYDHKLRYFRVKTTEKLYKARNKALEKCNGVFIAFLDCDDFWVPWKLESQLRVMLDKNAGMICGATNIFSEENSKSTLKAPKKNKSSVSEVKLNDLFSDYVVQMPTLMIRRSALNDLEKLCDDRFHIIGDFDIVVRLLVKTNLYYLSEPLAFYRMHDERETKKFEMLHATELETWYSENKLTEEYTALANFTDLRSKIHYKYAIAHLADGERSKALGHIIKIKVARYKIRALAGLFLPKMVIEILRH